MTTLRPTIAAAPIKRVHEWAYTLRTRTEGMPKTINTEVTSQTKTAKLQAA